MPRARRDPQPRGPPGDARPGRRRSARWPSVPRRSADSRSAGSASPARRRQSEGRRGDGSRSRRSRSAASRSASGPRRLRPAGILASSGRRSAAPRVLAGPSAAVGPYPPLGDCPVFPDPPAGLSARSPSLPNQAAWNQDVSKAPVAPNSAAAIAYIDSNGGDHLHPDSARRANTASPTPWSAPASARCRSTTPPTAARATPGPPDPQGAPVEGGNGSDGDRHVLVVDRGNCDLYELYRAFVQGGTGMPTRARNGTFARAPGDPTRGPRPTPPGCRSSPAWSATTRPLGPIDHAIRVTFESTRNAWVHPASHCAGDTDNLNARRWGRGCGCGRATASAASAARAGRSPKP